ncbi:MULTISPECIES: inositol monophosphatase family protein [Kribbella]|uniref:inositol monophosphatase family protein n=1 Tax=Kribbella TaxID=182639 RepID=UPI00104B5D44|nr:MULTISPECIES: inositol monophosphatase family protein [Kribbella]
MDVELAVEAALAGAGVVREKYGRPVGRYDKSATDFATDADLEAERAIVDLIRQARPDDAVVGEEYGAEGGSDDGQNRTWLVDPLCGTLNFAAQTPLFCTNVALQANGQRLVAAVADPLADEVFWTDGTTAAVRRGGSDAPLEPSAGSRIVDIDVDAPPDAEFRQAKVLLDPEFRDTFGPRVSSTTLALAWVAAGRRAAYVTNGQLRDSVHFTAGIALCLAAGCVVTDLRGQPLHTGPGMLAAADPATHAKLVELIARNP